MSLEEIPQDLGVLNYEILKLRKENEALRQQQNQENFNNYEESLIEMTENAKKLEEENKMLKNQLRRAIPTDQMNETVDSISRELQETQEKLSEAELKLEEQYKIAEQLKNQVISQENPTNDDSEVEILRQQLESANRENESLRNEIAEIQMKDDLEISKLAQQISELQKDQTFSSIPEASESERIKGLQEKIKFLEESAKSSEKMQLIINENLKTETELRILAEKRSNELYEALKQNRMQYEDTYSENETCVKLLMKVLKCSAVEIVTSVQEVIARKDELEERMQEKDEEIKSVEVLEKEIENLKNTTVDKKLFEEEHSRLEQLNSLIARSKQVEEELKEQLSKVTEESERKLEYTKELHSQEVKSYEEELETLKSQIEVDEQKMEAMKLQSEIDEQKLKTANDHIAALEQEKEALEKAKPASTTPHKSFMDTSNLSTSLAELNTSVNHGNSDADYLLVLNDAVNTIVKYISDIPTDNTCLVALSSFLEILIKRPFDFDGFTKSTEDLINSLEIVHNHYGKLLTLFDNISNIYDDVNRLLADLSRRVDKIGKKVINITPPLLVAKIETDAVHKRASRIPKPASKPSRILSPSKRNIRAEVSPPSARVPF